MREKQSKVQSKELERRNKILKFGFFIGIGVGIIYSLTTLGLSGTLGGAIGGAVMGVIIAFIIAAIVNSTKKGE